MSRCNPQTLTIGGVDNASTGNQGTEEHVIQFRLEAFNAFNHPSWGSPSGNILSGAAFAGAPSNAARQGFGVISSTAVPMRQLQLGLKYSF